ncbi:cytochrome c oxidase accessory protein CcoG [Nisaea acidiphila]|uniref:Cytochrome c oxidase accessory protein CcoG n=1 Tax=Nisaea acidiphila TaxID=1862145 RepID=A0A9J7ASQ9_9PROT|nr:cytochrome c oxidase accessory protein CcoG [Nisaea acidiphila]UUX50319.1 cytochrome c oxidase accessory protein CcoG [Nisaea acidiphila]
MDQASQVSSPATAPEASVEKIDVDAVNKKEERSLYKARVKIYPKRATGFFRKLKWLVMAATLAVYYVAPWLRWDRGPNAPDQAILIDFPARRFYFFFIEIWPEEVYYLTGLLIIAALGLFLITSLAGRVWCGYTCPQTVWTDLFIWVERFVEGDRSARIRLDKQPLSVNKVARKSVKHALWLLIGMATGGAWIFYFADAPTLLVDLFTLQAPVVAYSTVAVLTASTYIFGGMMREQVCTFMCPWPRIQGALVDEDSLIVSYKDDRGEPRAPFRKNQDWSERADCIDCNQCVAVCPMGIDIRDGQQLECIHCALCIDACNEVMTRIDRPLNLISYDTFVNHERRATGQPTQKPRLIRARTVIYSALISAVGLLMLATLLTRATLDINILHDRNPLFVKLSDGGVRNGYTIKILNKQHEVRRFEIAVDGLDNALVTVVGHDGTSGLEVPADKLAQFRVFVSVPPASVPDGRQDFDFIVTDVVDGNRAVNDTIFRGPEK